jgi:aromatic ring-cleaving dioxygenase
MASAAVPARRIDNNLKKTDILCWLIVNEQSTLLLIQHAMEDFIENHLTQPVRLIGEMSGEIHHGNSYGDSL